MSSDTRSTALALQALVRADPGNFLIPNAVRYLMGQRGEGHWRTTQESAVSLIALAEYIAQSGELEADYSYRARSMARLLKEGAVNRDNLKHPISIVLALADLKLGGEQPADAPAPGRSPARPAKAGCTTRCACATSRMPLRCRRSIRASAWRASTAP